MRWLRALVELVYPACCVACQVRLPEEVSDWLCETCRRTFRFVPPPRCPRCGRASDLTLRPAEPCARCQADPPRFDRAFVAYQYTAALRDCLHRVKFKSHAPLGRWLGDQLARLAVDHLQARYDLIVPVPLHRTRQRDRGFNQAELLAIPVSARLATPLDRTVLHRPRATPPQSQLDALARRANMQQAFAVTQAARVHGAAVLLVDDVLTTGATANACAEALVAAGTRSVDLLVLAAN